MSYVLEPDEAVGEALARVIREQAEWIDRACRNEKLDRTAFVHKARVRCKRIRAALRLARGLTGEEVYRRENDFWRDAARMLSGLRDLSARIEALDAMNDTLQEEIGVAETERIAGRFEKERAERLEFGVADPVAAFCARVSAHDADLSASIAKGDVADIARALGESYARTRRAMKTAEKKRRPELFHEWRKQAKYHALQVRLAQRIFPALEARLTAARDLGEHLGGVQDIEVVIQGLSPRTTRMRRALEDRRDAMVEEAFRAGKSLFSDRRKVWMAAALDLAPQPADL